MAVAAPGQAPDDAGADAADEHKPDGAGADAAENALDAPPTEMPGEVPDHDTEIHELIRDKLSGDLGNVSLGEAISGVGGSDDDAQANSQATSARENAQSDTANGGTAGDLPEQAADHVSAIHDAVASFIGGDGDGDPGDEVSGTANGYSERSPTSFRTDCDVVSQIANKAFL